MTNGKGRWGSLSPSCNVGWPPLRRLSTNPCAVGGSASVRSETGKGTCTRIRLPLTLAIVEGQCLQVGEEVYILPLTAIVESVRPAPGSSYILAAGSEVTLIRAKAVPLLRLGRLFGVSSLSDEPSDGIAVIVQHEGRTAALLVDRLLGQQQVVIKGLKTPFERSEGIAGATILGDGRVALILDVAGLMGLARPARGFPARDRTLPAPPPTPEPKTVAAVVAGSGLITKGANGWA
jgi:two-component system chemotaxis sensor kinase CheA